MMDGPRLAAPPPPTTGFGGGGGGGGGGGELLPDSAEGHGEGCGKWERGKCHEVAHLQRQQLFFHQRGGDELAEHLEPQQPRLLQHADTP